MQPKHNTINMHIPFETSTIQDKPRQNKTNQRKTRAKAPTQGKAPTTQTTQRRRDKPNTTQDKTGQTAQQDNKYIKQEHTTQYNTIHYKETQSQNKARLDKTSQYQRQQ